MGQFYLEFIEYSKFNRLGVSTSTSKETLATIKQPVLVVIGEADEDKEKARDLAAIFKHSSYSVVPGDHGSAVRTPEFAYTVIKFLKQ